MPSKKVALILVAVTAAAAGIYSVAHRVATPVAERIRPVAVSTETEGVPANSHGTKNDHLSTTAAHTIPVSASPETTSDSNAAISAFTEPYLDIAVAASEMGTLSRVEVQDGDFLKRGEVIGVMQDDVLRASLEVARRSMSVEGMLRSAEADLSLKKSEQVKLTQLRDRNHASQQEVDRIETELRVAEARLLSVREELEIKQLEFRRIESQLEQRVVRAPIDGIVSEVLREPGEFVSPSDPVIARIVQLDPLLIVFSVPLAQRNEIAKDQTVTLTIGESNQTAEGIVEYVSPTPDSSNSSVRVKVRLPNSDNRFQSGEPVSLVLDAANPPSSTPTQPESTPVARREQ